MAVYQSQSRGEALDTTKMHAIHLRNAVRKRLSQIREAKELEWCDAYQSESEVSERQSLIRDAEALLIESVRRHMRGDFIVSEAELQEITTIVKGIE